MWWYLLLVLFIFMENGSSQVLRKETRVIHYQIAGLFDKTATIQRNAFNESMHNVPSGEYKIQTVIVESQRSDSYSVWRDLCSKTMKPIAVIGPQTPISDGAIRHQCARSHIPHIQAAWQPLDPNAELANEETVDETQEDEEIEPTFKKISINFHPNSDELSIALARLLKFYNWESFTVLYEDDFGLMRMQKLLAEYTDKYPIIVRRLDREGNNKKIFKELYRFQESRIILDCHADRIMKYMEDASILYDESTMVSYYQHYIFASMDAATVADRLEKLDCNSTWLSLTRYDNLKISPLSTRVAKWNEDTLRTETSVPSFELEALIMDDIANHIIKSLRNMKKIHRPRNSICEKDENGVPIPWADGIEFQNQILNETSLGATGHIQFDEQGRRINYTLYVNEIHVKQRRIIGEWSSSDRSSIKESHSITDEKAKQKNSKEFLVMSRRNRPYFDFKQKCEGDNCEEDPNPEIKYEGFAVDLVDAIFKILRTEQGFNYTYRFVHDKDKEYGKYNKKEKKWNGLIGDLLNKKADLAVCDFTITEERKKVVDFSVPFMTLGISILYVQEHKVVPEMFSFLNPYTFEVWMYIATAYCVVSIVMYFCARISPADWENPEPCDKDPEFLENIWTFKNCVWLTMGSIMTQGCDILPKAFGTRWVCGMWWFFAVIICQTYIAQLSASMTSALAEEPINSAEDLITHNKIRYGAYRDGTTLEFFKTSKDKVYQQIYKNMMANDAVLTSGNDEGEKRVKNGNGKYAFFMESSTIEYKLNRDCELKKVGPELDSKDYGIAMPANSPFRSDINTAILRLKELTKLQEIVEKWWQNKYGAKVCPALKYLLSKARSSRYLTIIPSKTEGNSKSLTSVNDVEGDLEMENLQGAFIVLIGGLGLSLVITAAEFANEVRNIVVQEQVTHKEAFVKELKASLNFFQLQKPVLRNPSRAPSVDLSLDNEKKDKLSGIQNFVDFEKDAQKL